jgi:hypothetical protein
MNVGGSTEYGKILLIQLRWDQTGVAFFFKVGHPVVCQINNYVITVFQISGSMYTNLSLYRLVFVTAPVLGQLIRGVFSLDISFTCSFRVIKVVLCVFWSLYSWRSWWVFIVEEVDGAGDIGSGSTTTIDVQALEGLFELVCEICKFYW